MPAQWWMFLIVTASVLVVPGPDFVVVTRNTLNRGRVAGLGTTAGICCALAGYTALAATGVAALMAAHGSAATALRLAGAAYLALMGVRSVMRGYRSGRDCGTPESEEGPRRGSSFTQGLLTNLLNPKALVFFVSLLPQFVTDPERVAQETLLLGAAVVVLAAAWWCSYVSAIVRLSRLLRRPAVRRALDLASGVVLLGFAAVLLLR